MKKLFLTMITMTLMAISVNAQEVCLFNPDNILGLDVVKSTALAAGTIIGETESVVATIGADDTYKPQSATFTVNTKPITGGLHGGTNPKDADGGVPAITLNAPVSGAYLEFEAKADGFLYLMINASSNKAYTVFEEGTAIGYNFAARGDASTDLGAVYQFTLAGEGELNEVKNPIEWAEREFLKATDPEKYATHLVTNPDGTVSWTAIRVNGLGVIKFPVYKDCKYIVNANGTKIIAAGYVFSTKENVTITSADGVTIISEGDKTYSVIGTINGKWDTDTDMTWDENNKSYTVMFKNLIAGKYELKVRVNHDWTENYGDNGNNYVIDLKEDAATLFIIFDPKTKSVYHVITDGDEIPEMKKCAMPEISYSNGKITFSCETEGASYHYSITNDDCKTGSENNIQLCIKYKIYVYATKEGYSNSDIATREIVIENGQTSLFGDLNKDGKVNVADHVKLSDIIMNK